MTRNKNLLDRQVDHWRSNLGEGERAMNRVTLLKRTGRRDLVVLAGGAQDWAAASGQTLQEGV